jgi:hypothetical protein
LYYSQCLKLLTRIRGGIVESAYVTRSSSFIEYIKLHLISLEQDLESNPESINVIDIPGQIHATKHLLSVALDIMTTSERI